MQRLVLAGALAAGLFAQLAQEESRPAEQPEPITVRWDEMPNGQDFTRNYPHEAARRGVQGVALLCCSVREDRRLDCTIPLSWPAGHGFDTATLAIAEKFRVSEQSYSELQSAPPQPVRRWILWRLGERTSEFERAAAQVREAGRNMCVAAQ
ncbi:MAG: energy transducer TonB [Hyphomonadaceae bacterium]|nr:energy transducer TonB [Hyphomonadaceae bacterium]